MNRERPRETETPDGRLKATWHLIGARPLITDVEVRDDVGAVTFEVHFNPAFLPDLATARERMPRYTVLWDLIRAKFLAAVVDPCEVPALPGGAR